MGVTKKASLMIKKCLKLRAKRPNPFLMAQACLKLIYNHNIATTASLTPNSGAFL
ncbi:hypothetical protein [Helicobacter pylori]|uniref:hypothetical protein n=1 Tax=Helicobacter pylori TaxID=210 RepID=UPI00193A3730|nr:hypothetical protein [Helicobacter pylori]MBM2779094.1 hypothetical protein [Helicobacter pylori]